MSLPTPIQVPPRDDGIVLWQYVFPNAPSVFIAADNAADANIAMQAVLDAQAAAQVLAGFQAASDAAEAQITQNLADTLPSPAAVPVAMDAMHVAAQAGIANFTADIAAWATLTDDQKLSHVLGLMQSMVGVLQYLTGNYS